MLDTRTRQITTGATASGNGEATLHWTGYVSAAAAAATLTMWCAQRGGSGNVSSSNTFYRLAAEYLGG